MIIFVLLLGFGLRLISLNQSFWLDEATSALAVRMPLSQFFGNFMPGDFHPPLYYLTLRAWSMVFGMGEIALRSLSILSGVLTIYLVYLIGKKLISKETGVIASILLATSGLHIYYSQEARMYVMSTFLVTLVIYFFVKIFHEKGRVGDWIAFSLALGLIGLTDYLPLLILPIFWIYGFLSKKNSKWFSKLFMSHIILAICALLWSPVFIKQLFSGVNVTNTSPSWVAVLGTFSVKNILLIPVKFEIGRVSFEKYVYVFFVGAVTLIFSYLFYKSKKYFENLKLIYLWLFVPLLLALVVSIKLPVLNYFRFLFILPAFYLLTACGINALKDKKKMFLLLLVVGINLITSFMYFTNMKFQREDWRGTVKFVESNRSDNSLVVFSANSQMEGYRYYKPNALIYGPNAIKKGLNNIWLIRYAQPISDPQDRTRKEIEDLGYTKVHGYDFNGVEIWFYAGNN